MVPDHGVSGFFLPITEFASVTFDLQVGVLVVEEHQVRVDSVNLVVVSGLSEFQGVPRVRNSVAAFEPVQVLGYLLEGVIYFQYFYGLLILSEHNLFERGNYQAILTNFYENSKWMDSFL